MVSHKDVRRVLLQSAGYNAVLDAFLLVRFRIDVPFLHDNAVVLLGDLGQELDLEEILGVR